MIDKENLHNPDWLFQYLTYVRYIHWIRVTYEQPLVPSGIVKAFVDLEEEALSQVVASPYYGDTEKSVEMRVDRIFPTLVALKPNGRSFIHYRNQLAAAQLSVSLSVASLPPLANALFQLSGEMLFIEQIANITMLICQWAETLTQSNERPVV